MSHPARSALERASITAALLSSGLLQREAVTYTRRPTKNRSICRRLSRLVAALRAKIDRPIEEIAAALQRHLQDASELAVAAGDAERHEGRGDTANHTSELQRASEDERSRSVRSAESPA